jgi:hypothetical protein
MRAGEQEIGEQATRLRLTQSDASLTCGQLFT